MKKKTTSTKVASRPAKRVVQPSVQSNGLGSVQDVRIQIAARAYELYEQRGCLDGYHLHDWLTAEREILGHVADSGKSSTRI